MKVPFLDLSLQHRAMRSEALAALAATYDANRFCLGQDVDDFEQSFAQALGYPAALGLSSGTAPLHMACLMAGFGPGDEVITTPFTFISSAWGISYTGATPVFADIEPSSYNLDPEKLEAAITPRTKGIIVVHLFGLPARMDEILAVARRHGLFVIEDCAQAVGAQYRGTPVGLWGDVGTFSFYPTKNLGACGEAGLLVARDSARFARARLMRVHGSPRRYAHDLLGGNWRMDGFQAAILNLKLPRLAAWTARRREIAQRYVAEIHLAEARLPTISTDYGESVLHQFTLTHPQRDALREHLSRCDVGTDLIYPQPLHLQKCYADLGYTVGSFPVAECVAARCLSLPIFPELTDAQVAHVIASVNAFEPAAAEAAR